MEILIDLNNPKRAKQNIALSWDCEITEKTNGAIQRIPFIRKHLKIEKQVSLFLKVISVDSHLICDHNKLFSIVMDGIEYVSESKGQEVYITVPMTLARIKTPFQVFFDTSQVTDCREQQKKEAESYPVEFEVALKDNNGNEIKCKEGSQTIKLQVKFASLDPKPKVNFVNQITDIQYLPELKQTRIASLSGELSSSFVYTPKVNVHAKLSLRNITEGEDWTDKLNTSKISFDLTNTDSQELEVLVDFSKISNPVQEKILLRLTCEGYYTTYYDQEVKYPLIINHSDCFVLKDTCGTELRVVSEVVPEEPIPFLPFSTLPTERSIKMYNIASTPNKGNTAGLIISHLEQSTEILDGVEVLGKEDNVLQDFVNIDGDDIDRLRSKSAGHGLFIPNAPEAYTEIRVTFDHSQIADLNESHDYCFKAKTTLSFRYYENRDGLPLNRLHELKEKEHKEDIEWYFRLLPNDQWLCIDYGSSAIVCQNGDSLIKLGNRRKKLIGEKDPTEPNENFLSSDVSFHAVDNINPNISTLCTEQPSIEQRIKEEIETRIKENQNKEEKERKAVSLNDKEIGDLCSNMYNELSIYLSPTLSMRYKDIHLLLPCLKILVGNEFLPDEDKYLQFSYRRRDSQGQVTQTLASASRYEEKSLLRVQSILREAYSSLLRYYIKPEIDDINRLNKVILTYPNTYTPTHRDILKKIVKGTFPRLRESYLRTVSESDAVAAYYLDHWNTYNRNSNVENNETVLIYDMGAGTLDVTLFRKKYCAETDTLLVDIVAKIGTGKAGNYLDYVLSEILTEKMDLEERDIVVNTKRTANSEVLNKRQNIKMLVKDKLKPSLSLLEKQKSAKGNDSFPVLLQDLNAEEYIKKYEEAIVDSEKKKALKEIKIKEILGDEKFTTFIDDVTKGILSQIKKYMDISEENSLDIDTIIMSGRSCQLKPLYDALNEQISKFSHGRNCFVTLGDKPETMKTVVVQGAMAYVRRFSSDNSDVKIVSRRQYASYGLVYKTKNGYKYVELFNYNDMPFNGDERRRCGAEKILEGATSTDNFKLIQTYLSPAQTEEALNSDRRELEFITEMEVISREEFADATTFSAHVILERDDKIILYINKRRTKGRPPKGIDLSSEITKRSIWPVTI